MLVSRLCFAGRVHGRDMAASNMKAKVESLRLSDLS